MDQEIILQMSRRRAFIGFVLATLGGAAMIVILLLGFQVIPNDWTFRERRLFWVTPIFLILAIYLIVIGVQGLKRCLVIRPDGRAVFRKSRARSEEFLLVGEEKNVDVVARCISRRQTKRPAFNIFLAREGRKDRKLLNAVTLSHQEITKYAYSPFLKFDGLQWTADSADMTKEKHQGRP